MKKIFPLLAAGVLFMVSCNKSESPVPSSTTPEERSDPSSLNFSGYTWTVKNSGNALEGPGANYFSKNNVYVDDGGILHLEINKQNNKWKCGEIYSNDNFGYGTYIFVTKGDLEDYDQNIVVGLFTWDDLTFQTEVNDELDAEFSKWGNPKTQYDLEYSVQPDYGKSVSYPERTTVPGSPIQYDANGLSTQIIKWTSTYVKFESHIGDDTTASTLIQSWTFNNSNPPRQGWDGTNLSDPIVIPVPGSETKAHINFWLFDKNGDGKVDAPKNKQNAELLIQRFQYLPQ